MKHTAVLRYVILSAVFLLLTPCSSLPGVGAALSTVGCYSDQPSDRDPMKLAFQQNKGLSVYNCASFCSGKGSAYAGLFNGSSCYCADEFGLTDAVVSCNLTCGSKICGGVDSYAVYYVVDDVQGNTRTLDVTSEKKNFLQSRRECVKMGGDLMGRSFQEAAVVEKLALLFPTSQSTSTLVWLGLRKRQQVYEWVDEREPTASDTYSKNSFTYQDLWKADDADEKCVTYDLHSKQLASHDCGGSFLAVCSFFNTSSEATVEDTVKQLTQQSNQQADDKTLALFIVLPVFLLCYGGACILYCIHKILKHCCKQGAYSQHIKLQQKPPSRPPSAKKNAVYPMTETPMLASPMALPLTPAEEKKLKLLENASKEAKRRRDAEGLASKRLEDTRPPSARSSGRLLPPMSMQPPAPPASSCPPLSINEILRNKMEQQANRKKPKRIITTQ